MVTVLFRSRLRPGIEAAYAPVAARMEQLVAASPGFLSHRSFQAEDGERLSLIYFESLEAVRIWREHPEHREAQRRGRREFYSEYHLQVLDAEPREVVFDAARQRQDP